MEMNSLRPGRDVSINGHEAPNHGRGQPEQAEPESENHSSNNLKENTSSKLSQKFP